MSAIGRRFHKEIEKFFEGKSHWEIKENQDANRIWVARHQTHETLVIEPREGGQYEIAVRVVKRHFLDGRKPEYVGYWVDSHFHCVGVEH